MAVIFIAVVLFALSQAGDSDIVWAIGTGVLSSRYVYCVLNRQ